MSLKIENSRRVAKSRPVCIGPRESVRVPETLVNDFRVFHSRNILTLQIAMKFSSLMISLNFY
jgi:hypothetical protein